MENNQPIKSIDINAHQKSYSTQSGYRFERITKNGEMASINWIQVIENGRVILEVRESDCVLYF